MARSNLFQATSVVLACVLGGVTAYAGGNGSGDSVCADLIGSEYAACHTYCEALKCGSDEQTASPKACDRALQRFLDLSGGEQPPCFEVPGDHGETATCPCSFGWRNPNLFPADWDAGASSCNIYKFSGGTYIDISLENLAGRAGYTTLSSSVIDTPSNVGVSFSCNWGGSSDGVNASGEVQFGDNTVPPGEVDGSRYEALMAVCEADLAGALMALGFDVNTCTVTEF